MRAALGALLYALIASNAHASPLLETAGGSNGLSGLQGRVSAGGASAAYFNPALLTDVPGGITAGFVVLGSRISIAGSARSSSADVPNSLGNAYHADGSRWDNYPVGTENLQNGVEPDGIRSGIIARPRQAAGSNHATYTYEAIGIVLPLFEQRLTLAFFGMIPNSSFTELKGFYVDEREQYFSNSLHPEFYSDRLLSLAMALGAGFRISDTLSVGLGTTLSLRADVSAPVYVVDAGRLQDLMLDTGAKVNVGLAPHGGIAYRPLKRLRLTFTAHAPQKVEFAAKFRFLLATGTEQSSSIIFVHDYMPWQIGLGGSYDLAKSEHSELSVNASAVYGRWSQYVDRHGDRPSDAYAFSDTVTAGLGARYRVGDVSVGLDTQYKPTPVPTQTGRSNYVDNDRVGMSLSAEYAFRVWNTGVRAGAQLAAYRMVSRFTRKLSTPTFEDGRNRTPNLVKDEVPDDGVLSAEPIEGREGLQTNNPGWPGFSSGGYIASGSLYMTVML
ncbi:MAG: hypothetical protein RL385_3402 [Pseudomonadota bacterium]|jgi:hypothetical protein